ncbi:MAG: ATP-binding protein [Chloroflexota bacterium]
MFLPSKTELLEKIRLGEDTYLELKEVRFSGERLSAPTRNDLADELAALANSHGGVLVLGVQDKTHEILGLPHERLDTIETFLREVCNDSLHPPLAPIIERLELSNSAGEMVALIRVDVPRSLFVHQSPGGYFYRLGSSKRQMPPDYLARLFQQRSQTRLIRFDEQAVTLASLEDFETGRWERFATPRTKDTPENLLQKLGMARLDEEGVLRPTVAGVLLGTSDPQRFLPNAYIQAVAYRGVSIQPEGNSIYQRDAQDITGALDEQILAAVDFVRKNMFVMAYKEQGRTDLPQYDLIAIFEAITNAVAHRDYSIYGAKIRLRMFDDRLELYSPGAIPNTLTVESLPYRQFTRNETITSLLARCPVRTRTPELQAYRTHIMDKRGEGVPLILSRSEALANRRPEYRLLDDAELLLTIYGLSL